MESIMDLWEDLKLGGCPSWPIRPEVIETHISKVFLLEDAVYKFKKPLVLSFLDYGTRQKRLEACWQEFDLGRRFGGDIYRSVVLFQRDHNGDILIRSVDRQEPLAEAGEYAVEMARLERTKLMDWVLEHGEISATTIDFVMNHLVRCDGPEHRLPLLPEDYTGRIYRHIDENRATGESLLARYPDEQKNWQILSGRLLMGWARRQRVLSERAVGQKIVDGHGDLRPEHVFLGKTVAFIDSVEFSLDFRTIDMLDELCFLAMECRFLGCEDVAEKLLTKGIQALGDDPPESLARFYQAYRAMVRAKVHFLRAQQLADPQGQHSSDAHESFTMGHRYLKLALKLMSEGVSARSDQCVVLVVSGGMGTGKSTLAREIARRLGCQLLQTDRIRHEVFKPLGGQHLAFGEGKYGLSSRLFIYEKMVTRMEQFLQAGFSVVLDGSFGEPLAVEAVTSVLKNKGLPYVFFHCEVPPGIAEERIRSRLARGHSPSEARPELLREHLSRMGTNPNCL